jgi:tellurite resistance protein TehA-like permease
MDRLLGMTALGRHRDGGCLMRSLLMISGSVVLAVLSAARTLSTHSRGLFLFGILVTLFFSSLSLYLILESKVGSGAIIRNYKLSPANRRVVVYSVYIVGLLTMDILLFFFTPADIIINWLRVALMCFSTAGIVLLGIGLIKMMANSATRNSGSGHGN